MVAGQCEHVRVLPEVLPVLVGVVLQKGWTHDEYVVKIPFEILFQHFQKVVRLSASGHADDKHVKGCVHRSTLVLHTLEFVFHYVYDSVRDHEDVAGQICRVRLFFYLQEDPGLCSNKFSPAAKHVLVVDRAEVDDAGEPVGVKLPAGNVREIP